MTQLATTQNGAPAPAVNIMQMLQQTPASKIPSLPQVEKKFIDLVMKIQRQDKSVAEAIFHAETFHYLKLINENQSVRECEPLSLYGCFVDMAVNGLSFDPSKKLCYIMPGNVNVGSKDTPQWVKRASLAVSPYGELAIRQRDGQIKYADNPVIVYEGDVFKPFVGEDGQKRVQYEMNINHGTTIVGAFIRLVRHDGTSDVHWLLKEDILRLSGYSARKNKGNANALYSSQNGGIDPGFLGAKMIKHAFKSYPKVKIGGSFAVEDPAMTEQEEVDYGFDEKALPAPPANLPHPSMIVSPVTNGEVSDAAKAAMLQATAETPEMNGTVQYSDDHSEGF
jgi:recombinational DNA repair protein RecT